MAGYIPYEIPRDDLSGKLGGDLAKGTITIIKGIEGAGKSVFAQRFAYGFLKNGMSVTYISSEMSTRDFIKQMNSLDYGIMRYLLKKQLLFIPVFPITMKYKKNEFLIQKLMAASAPFKNDVVIIDMVNTLVESEPEEQQIRTFVNFLKRLTGVEKTFIITVDPKTANKRAIEMIEGPAENIISLETKVFQTDLKNVATITRWGRSQQEVNKVIAYRVEPKIGIIIDISAFSG